MRTGALAMPRRSPYRISLSRVEERELQKRAAKYTLPYFQVVRAKMVLLAAQGLANDEIAASLGTRREVVSLWRKRFFEERLAGLEERPRPGRPRTFPPRVGRSGEGPRLCIARQPRPSALALEHLRLGPVRLSLRPGRTD